MNIKDMKTAEIVDELLSRGETCVVYISKRDQDDDRNSFFLRLKGESIDDRKLAVDIIKATCEEIMVREGSTFYKV